MAPIPVATAAAAPPDEPPGVIAALQGLRVCPCRLLRVNQRSENAGGYANTSWADHAVKVVVA